MKKWTFSLPPATLPNALPRRPAARSALTKKQRWDALLGTSAAVPVTADFAHARFHVVLTREARRSADIDNLVASLKATRDGIADALMVGCLKHHRTPCGPLHDGPDGNVRFDYDQNEEWRFAPQTRVEVEKR